MKTKLLTVLAAALSLGAVSSFAQGAAPAAASSWKITPTIVSEYMFRGVRLGGAAFQPSAEYTSGALTAGIWANVPLENVVPGQSDPEFDFYGSYSLALAENVSLVPGATLYTYPDADADKGFYSTTFEPSLALNFTLENIVITPKFYYDTTLQGATWELNGAAAFPLTAIGTELSLYASVGTYKWRESIENSSPEVKNRGDYWVIGANLPFKVSSNGTVTVGYARHQGHNNYYSSGGSPRVRNTAARGADVFSASYSFSF